jgi:heme oxygenase
MSQAAHLNRLRERTQSVHESTETLVESHRLLSGSPSKAHYGRLLKAHLALHLQVQCQTGGLHENQPTTDLLDWPDCHRIAALRQDLENLGESDEQVNPITPTTASRPFSIGLMYVCEGSCLGNQQLMAAMNKSESFHGWQASAFFASCKEGFGQRWRTMLDLIDSSADVDYEELEQGALSGFDAFKLGWLAASS